MGVLLRYYGDLANTIAVDAPDNAISELCGRAAGFFERSNEGGRSLTLIVRRGSDGVTAKRLAWVARIVDDGVAVTQMERGKSYQSLQIRADHIILSTPNSGHAPLSLVLLRVLRALSIGSMMRRGALLLHASALAGEERAIIFIGNKGAGKTTLMLHGLRAGFKFVSNDRVLLSKEGNVTGVPMASGLNRDTLEEFEELAMLHAEFQYSPKGKVLFTVQELTQAFGTEIAPVQKLGAVVLLDRVSHPSPTLLESLGPNEIESTLKLHELHQCDDNQSFWDLPCVQGRLYSGTRSGRGSRMESSAVGVSPLRLFRLQYNGEHATEALRLLPWML